MQQSNVIFANLLIAYFLFITMRGELPAYLTILRGGGQQGAGAVEGSAGGNLITQGAAALLNDNPFNDSAINSMVDTLSSNNAQINSLQNELHGLLGH